MGQGNTNRSVGASRPEHLFDCPPNFLEFAELYTGSVSSKLQAAREDVGDGGRNCKPETETVVDLSVLSVKEQDGEAGVRWTCNGCRALFQSLEEQRSHFKSDYHRLNVKRRVVGKDPISEEQFEAIAERQWKVGNNDEAGISGYDDVSSISGSEDESDEPEEEANPVRLLPRSNRIYFILPDVKEVLSLWRPLLIGEKEHVEGEKGGSVDSKENGEFCVRQDDLLLRLKSVIWSGSGSSAHSSQQSQVWVVLLVAGGHFAGVVVKMKGVEILAHHTFHRYVVRAKAGGRQSTQDKTGRAPKSAGASLRRYNEAALQNEIRNLLTAWGEHIRSASHIFVHAPSANGQALFGGDNAPLNRSDLRIRRIPFTTRRPTLKEAKRVHHVLSTIYYDDESTFSNDLSTQGVDGRKEGAKKGLKIGDNQLGKTKEPIKTDTQDPLKTGAEEIEPSGNSSRKEASPLILAAKAGDFELVVRLLEDGLDPCVKDEGGYTPYARAKDKDTRNVFRRFMARHPDKWDWQAANVPSALTEEMETAQAAKQAEKDLKRKEKEKERKRLRKEELRAKEAEKKSADLAAAALANVRGTGPLKKASKESAGFQEALLKAQALEREVRAAAAEQRMRAMLANKESLTLPSSAGSTSVTSSSCSCCGDPLISSSVFYRLTYKYCSTTCVQVHKKYLNEQ